MKKHFLLALMLFFPFQVMAGNAVANSPMSQDMYLQDDSGWLPPFDYDFGGFTWAAGGSANVGLPSTLPSGTNKYDNYLFETRPVSEGRYVQHFRFRYEYKKQVLMSDTPALLDTAHVNDVLFIYRVLDNGFYADLGWGMRALSTTSGLELYGNWYMATGIKIGEKFGIHYQSLNAVQGADRGSERTMYVDYLVGYKSYLMVGYKQQHLSWNGASNSSNLEGYLAGVYFRF